MKCWKCKADVEIWGKAVWAVEAQGVNGTHWVCPRDGDSHEVGNAFLQELVEVYVWHS